ncbi:Maf family protein [Aeromicrobium piscarium]|uniref:Maf family protein n=1 Tax=Aeromicrobium piscarium TaxID=2590901 RepID=UPI001C8F92D7|nr:Maf family protein [Aeromicrobium piscarium]
MVTPLVLASASPARLETLRRAGVEPEVIVSGVDETEVLAATPGQLASSLAQMKCRAVAVDHPDRLVLGCDSVLEFDGEPLGKPHDPRVARERWRAMRGNAGVLHTGHCVRLGDDEVVRSVATRVHFAYVTDDEIDAYVATGEPLQVAGAFTIDGLGGAFISRIEGDHHNVTGLSLPVLRDMLHDFDIVWTDLWSVR